MIVATNDGRIIFHDLESKKFVTEFYMGGKKAAQNTFDLMSK